MAERKRKEQLEYDLEAIRVLGWAESALENPDALICRAPLVICKKDQAPIVRHLFADDQKEQGVAEADVVTSLIYYVVQETDSGIAMSKHEMSALARAHLTITFENGKGETTTLVNSWCDPRTNELVELQRITGPTQTHELQAHFNVNDMHAKPIE